MRYTIDDIHALRASLHLPALTLSGALHGALDDCDRACGLQTRHGRRNVYGLKHEQPIVQEYVGARLARLQAHLSRSAKDQRPYFFHLGDGRCTCSKEAA